VRTLLSFITYIFLSTAFCAEAQETPSAELEAVLCERTVWAGADPQDSNEALLRKASICYGLGRFHDARSALGRVRRYMLTDAQNVTLLEDMLLCCYMEGDLDGAMSAAVELGLVGATAPAPHLPDGLMTVLGLLPPLGHICAGKPSEGLLSAALNAGSILWTVLCCMDGAWVGGLLGGGMALDYTWLGSRERVAVLTEGYNQKERLKYLEALLKPIYDQIISSR